MNTTYLANNRAITNQDYMKTFIISKPTAIKVRKADQRDFDLKKYMVSHFFEIYQTYPKGFRPRIIELEVSKSKDL